MTPAQKILELIENVDPADSAAMDEIDARVWCWINDCEFFAMSESPTGRPINYITVKRLPPLTGYYQQEFCWPLYTRSRDALKAIRPEGYLLSVEGANHINAWFCDLSKGKWLSTQFGLPTEELAELHAIIQAIEWERNNGKI